MNADSQMTGADWDERFEEALAASLRQYLRDDPPPPGSEIGRDAAKWASNLELRAEARRVGLAPESEARS